MGANNLDGPSKGDEYMAPHVLAMSATPIPRTLALALYGDMSLTQVCIVGHLKLQFVFSMIPCLFFFFFDWHNPMSCYDLLESFMCNLNNFSAYIFSNSFYVPLLQKSPPK